MTVAAVLIGVRTDRGVLALGIIMTAHAVRRLDRELAAEAMTVLAAWGRGRADRPDRIERVQRRLDVRVALLAQLVRRRAEPIAVTLAASHMVLPDVDRVTRTLAHLAPRRRDVLQLVRPLSTAGDGQHEPRTCEPARHRAPIGWHIRHGIDDSGCRLEYPGGCGLPPTPPTA